MKFKLLDIGTNSSKLNVKFKVTWEKIRIE